MMDASLSSYQTFKFNLEKCQDDSVVSSTPLNSSSKAGNKSDEHKQRPALRGKNGTGLLEPGNGDIRKYKLPGIGNNMKGGAPLRQSRSLYRCYECGKDYLEAEPLRKHLLNHLVKNGEKEPPYTCRRKNCHRMFDQKSDRRKHEKTHLRLKEPMDFHIERIRKLMENL